MPCYVVGLMKVTNPEGMPEYVSRVKPVISQYGGRTVFAGEVVDVVEGTIEASTGAVIEFDDAEAATRWFHSPEYTELKRLRSSLGTAHHVLMQGADGAAPSAGART